MYYGDKRESKANIAECLMERGWKVYGYSPDQSDSMTDYYHPASWDGIAEKNGYILCVDNKYQMSYSGKEVYKYTKEPVLSMEITKKITKLENMTQANGATAGEEENARNLIQKLKESQKDKEQTRENSRVIDFVYPVFMENPRACNWHIEKNGKILAKGNGAFQFNSMPYNYNVWNNEFEGSKTWNDGTKKELTEEQQKTVNKFKTFILRLENIAAGVANMGDGTEETEAEGIEAEQKEGYEKITVTETKTVTKPVKVDRTEIKEGDILSFSYHGHFWIVDRVWNNTKNQVCITYELLGKRGFQRVKNTKRYYQLETKLQKEFAEGKAVLHELRTIDESKEVEKWVKIDRTKKANNTKQAQEPKQQPKQTTAGTITEHEYTITADVDTRDNSPLWVVKIVNKLSKEEYIKTAESFKKIKGFYSKFKKGFIFRYDPAEVLKGEEITEQPNQLAETIDNLVEHSTNTIIELGLNSESYPTSEEYKNAITEYLQKYNIRITTELLELIPFDGLKEVIQTIKTEAEQKAQHEQQQAEKGKLMEKITKGIESLESKINALSGDYKTNTWKRIQEQASRDKKKESLEIDVKLLEHVQDKLINNEPITALEKALLVGAFRNEIHSYYIRKYGKYPQEIKFPQVNHSLPSDSWYNREVPQMQNKLRKYGITNTTELVNAIEEYKTIYNSVNVFTNPIQQKIKRLTNEYKLQQKGDINFTPEKIVDQLIEYAQINHNSRVLEPSAGVGNIADKVKEITEHVDVCEQMYSFNELLQLKGHNTVGTDFLSYNNYNYYDCIIMNPPFSAEQEHIKHAYNLLKPGGRIVSITSPSWTFNSNNKSQEFRKWFNNIGGEIVEELGTGTFEMTVVSTRIIVIDKEEELKQAAI